MRSFFLQSVAALFCATVVYAAGQSTPLQTSTPPTQSSQTLSKVRDFSFTTLHGVQGNLRALSGKTVVLDFWCLYCPGYQYEINTLNRLADKFKGDTNVVILLVATDAKSDMQDFCSSRSVRFAVIPDGTDICNASGIERFPTYFIIDGKGNTVQKGYGGLESTFDEISESVEKFIAVN